MSEDKKQTKKSSFDITKEYIYQNAVDKLHLTEKKLDILIAVLIIVVVVLMIIYKDK